LKEQPLKPAQPPEFVGPVEPPVKAAVAAAKPDPRMEKLVKALQSPLKADRMAAMKEVGNRGTAGKDAIPFLTKPLRREHKDEPEQAARTLAQIGAPAVPELIQA